MRNRIASLVAGCACAVSMVACAVEPSTPTGTTRAFPVTGGVPVDSDPAVVALIAGDDVFCTGTLIAPQVVVTAAHCVHGVYGSSDLEVLFGADPDTGDTIAVIDVLAHDGFDSSSLINDIALLFLEHAPPDVDPMPMLVDGPPSLVGYRLRLVGFGLLSAADTEPARKREGWTTITEQTDVSFTFHPNPSQTCFGDSGGPAFAEVDGVEYLVGVTSAGDSQCDDYGRDTRIDAFHAAFIAPYLTATADGAAAIGQRCLSDAHCDTGACVTAADDPDVRFCSTACGDDSTCPAEMPCGGDRMCRHPLPTPRALGAACDGAGDCASGFCLPDDGAVPRVCTRRCLPAASDCPAGFECLEYLARPSRFACLADSEPPAAVGCRATGAAAGGAGGAAVIAIVLGVALAVSRRRSATQPMRSRS